MHPTWSHHGEGARGPYASVDALRIDGDGNATTEPSAIASGSSDKLWLSGEAIAGDHWVYVWSDGPNGNRQVRAQDLPG